MANKHITVCVLNRKGGSGKTTSVINIAGALVKLGEAPILTIDLDTQCSLTQCLGKAADGLDPRATTAALFAEAEFDPVDLLHGTQCDGITLAPACEALDEFDIPLPAQNGGRRQLAVREFLQDVGGRFAFTLIDLPPTLRLCTWAALLASDFVLIPLQPEVFSLQGIQPVLKTVEAARHRNPRLNVLGYLLTMLQPRLAMHQRCQAELKAMFPDQVFDAVLPLSKDFKESVLSGLPVTHLRKAVAASKAAQAVAKEILQRACALPVERKAV